MTIHAQRINTIVFILITSLISLLHCSDVNAFEFDSDDFTVNGFGTLGVTKADNEYFSSRNSISQDGVFDEWSFGLDSRIGLQLDYDPTDTLSFSVQFVAAERAENSFNKSLHSAYVSFDLSPSWELRLGRQAANFFMLSTYRHVGFAQLWAHPITEFYGQISTDYGDGIGLNHQMALHDGVLRTQFWLNKATLFYYTNEVTTFNVEPNYGLMTTWESDTWSFSFMYTTIKFDDENGNYQPLENAIQAMAPLWPDIEGLDAKLSFDDNRAHYYSLGASYDANNWVVRTEVGYINTKSFFSDEVRSGYVLIGHRFNTITPFVALSAIKNKRTDIPAYSGNNPFVLQLEQNLNDFAHYFHQSQKTLSVGFRWDVKPKVAVKAQLDRTWIGAYGGGLTQQRALINNTETINRLTLTMDFLF